MENKESNLNQKLRAVDEKQKEVEAIKSKTT